MNCCVNCFADQGLQSTVKTISKDVGLCDFCDSKDVNIVSCKSLSDLFGPLLELYTNHPKAQLSLGENSPVLSHNHLLSYWPRLFNSFKLKPKDVKLLVYHIGSQYWLGLEDKLFEQPIFFYSEIKLICRKGNHNV